LTEVKRSAIAVGARRINLSFYILLSKSTFLAIATIRRFNESVFIELDFIAPPFAISLSILVGVLGEREKGINPGIS
jgi:hypothetical protein